MRIGVVFLMACQMLFGQAGIALVGAGYVNPIPVRVAPGQVVTFFLTGLQTVLPPPFRAERAPSVPLRPARRKCGIEPGFFGSMAIA